MDDKRSMLRHFLAAIAYRTQKAVRNAQPEFAVFEAGNQVRQPIEIVRHMRSVLGYARTFFIGGRYTAEEMDSFDGEVRAFHEMLESLARHLINGDDFIGTTPERLLQGPFSDAMTHAGQLAMLRRLADDPIPPENFIMADVSPLRLGPDQPDAVSPDAVWPEAPSSD